MAITIVQCFLRYNASRGVCVRGALNYRTLAIFEVALVVSCPSHQLHVFYFIRNLAQGLVLKVSKCLATF